jgi:hypothetical protein
MFGLKNDVRNNLHYMSDNVLLYPAGHNVVMYHIDEKTQNLIPGKSPDPINPSLYRYRGL